MKPYVLDRTLTLDNMKFYLAKFRCQRCKESCCTKVAYGIILKDAEVEQLAELKKLSKSKFKEELTFTKDGKRFMVSPCPFYDAQVNCSIHSYRPQVCRQYPFNRSYQGHITANPNCPAGILVGEKYGVKLPEMVKVSVLNGVEG